MKLFFDTEFTGLHANTNLISIGIVDECDNSFYAEFNDYDESQVNSWIRYNVINNLLFNKSNQNILLYNENTTLCVGNKKFISKNLNKWLEKYKNIQFVSDVPHYDFVLLIDLMSGDALKLNSNISPCCYDVNQLISEYNNICLNKAFDISREQILIDNNILLKNSYGKHNSLNDAIIIKEIYNIMN